MKILVINTPRGLVPMYDDDYEEKKKLKLGQTYWAEFRAARNVDFHEKYFVLIAYAWEHLTEAESATFITKDGFRKSVEMAAGHYSLQYDLTTQSYVHVPKSISFDKMDNFEFSDLYSRVKDVIFALIGHRLSQKDFEQLVLDF